MLKTSQVIIATETRLYETIRNSEILPPYYRVRRCNRNREAGSYFVAMADHLTSCKVPELAIIPGCELVWLKIELKGKKDLLIAAYYKTDDGDEGSLNTKTASLLQSIESSPSMHTW